MCGIAGFLNLDQTPVSEKTLRCMLAPMISRGPDGEGIKIIDNLALGHRRLAVIDLMTGDQPICNEDGSVWIILNGEIFNYRELKNDLLQRGHHFKTSSDTEVMVHLYEEYGTDFIKQLDGFFGFTLYDVKQKKFMLGRDRLGIKPLFYFQNDGVFAFASTLTALKQHPAFPHKLNRQAVWDFLSLQYVPQGTIYLNVKRVKPGTVLIIEDSICKIQSYWSADYSHKLNISYPDAMHELDQRVREAVKKRLIADVPLGIFLSGGLDSTIVAGLAAELVDKPLRCYSIAFHERAYDERAYAVENATHLRQFAKHGLEHKIREVDPCKIDVLEKLICEYGEPYADASMIPTSLLSQFAREEVTVVLGGDGADEIFRGYERYIAMRYLSRFNAVPSCVFKLLHALIPERGGERGKSARIRRFLHAAEFRGAERYLSIVSHTDEALKKHFCTDWFEGMQPTLHEFDANHYFERGNDCSEFDLHTYLLCDTLPKADLSSMSASLELRSPFLDHQVVEFAASLPDHYKEHKGFRKRILADTFAKYLPEGLAHRRKRGFGVPLADWFRGPWRKILQETLLDGEAVKRGIFHSDGIQTLIAEHTAGRDHSYVLFSALVLELFLRHEKM